MTPAQLNLSIYTGATFGPVELIAKDKNGAIVDLTGWSVWAEVRESPSDTLVVDLAPTIVDATAGKIHLTLTDEQTAVLSTGTYQWDLLMENPTGERLGPYIAGTVHINPRITQPSP